MTLVLYLFECLAGSEQRGCLAGVGLPAPHGDVGIDRVDFDTNGPLTRVRQAFTAATSVARIETMLRGHDFISFSPQLQDYRFEL